MPTPYEPKRSCPVNVISPIWGEARLTAAGQIRLQRPRDTGQARDSREARWLPATIQLTFEPNDRRLIVDRGHRIQSSFCQGYERPLTDIYKLPS